LRPDLRLHAEIAIMKWEFNGFSSDWIVAIMNSSSNRGMIAMRLYHYSLSGHAHRAALFLSLAGVAHELIEVDLAAGAHREPQFLALNAFGEVPVLEDEGIVIADSI